ncbi:zinc ABC transporter ATP-binding protein AztA [Streptomyces iconiensis]|uniref:Zinc ABC transporter ATP-binding protein AztA n=1 Tax=Streptomyces iconiensis TaxID=1384038 RepID=A0ABT6ZU60_9ACTN|nr:zinc ABC transporter ATP-binding protein AztA [Streptomyces iconiensis]MDJ1132176.1 zinc ABC transporter ATP-binding protein AztA [Streptomyces iconiensis]
MPPPPEQQAVELRSAEAGYPLRPVLRQLTASVPQSAITAVVGPNGSGKSTLLSVLAGVLPLTAGTMERAHTSRPGFVLQRSAVSDTFPLTVRDTVTMGRWAHRGPWRRLTSHDRSVVERCMDRLGISDLAGRQLGELSGGQRQRALVAQGLAQEAGLFLLDEPTTGLDIRAKEGILAVLDGAAADGVTVVQATHDLVAARQADHCLLLRDGRLVAQGAPDVVLTDEALRHIWDFPVAAV